MIALYSRFLAPGGVTLVLAAVAAAAAEPRPHSAVGTRWVPTDVDWERPIYATGFDSSEDLAGWALEGGRRMAIEEGCLVLESAAAGPEPSPTDNHLVCWLKREVPGDFLLEFRVCPENRSQGLNIIFFNARGIRGESIFDPALPARTGFFAEYHSGALNNYHISYWAGARGTANVRKNHGFQLVATGPDLVSGAPAGTFQTIRLYKRDGTIRLTVDGVVAVAFDDDGIAHGPVWTHPGWIGLRQMGHTVRCRYDDLRIHPLRGRRENSQLR